MQFFVWNSILKLSETVLTSNLFFRIAMSAAYRLRSLTAYWCFCLHSFFFKVEIYRTKCWHLTLSRGGTPWISTLHHLTCLCRFSFSRPLFGGGGNHSQLAIPFNGGLGRVVGHGGGEGSNFFPFFLSKFVFWSPPSFC